MVAHLKIQRKYLFFRKDAKEILNHIFEKKKIPRNVYLDFSRVKFFSRSFIDELLNVISKLKEKEISVVIQNLNPQLRIMMDRVQKTKAEIQRAIA